MYLGLVWQRLHPVDHFSSRVQHHSDQELIPACVHILCAYTFEHFVPHLHSSFLIGSNWNLRQMILQKSLLWDNNKFQTARRTSWELFVFSWTTSFTVRVTESGPKSRDHSIPLMETEKIMLPYHRLKNYETRLEMNFWLTVSTSGESTRLC